MLHGLGHVVIDATQADAQVLGNLWVGQAIELREDEHLLDLRPQALQQAVDFDQRLQHDRLLLQRRMMRFRQVGQGIQIGLLQRAPTQQVDQQAFGNA
ncbi:hypothetical protein D3C76_1519560 [compost metagenome]